MANSPARKMKQSEKLEIIENCMTVAQALWESLSLIEAVLPSTLIGQKGYQLIEDFDFAPLAIFALCDPNEKTVKLNTRAVEKVSAILKAWAEHDEQWAVDFQSLVLWHELFHIFEEEDATVYTRQPILTQRFLGRNKRLPLDCASEIGAIYFSKLATGLSFNPRVFEGLAPKVFEV
jgi:hypothetical protein